MKKNLQYLKLCFCIIFCIYIENALKFKKKKNVKEDLTTRFVTISKNGNCSIIKIIAKHNILLCCTELLLFRIQSSFCYWNGTCMSAILRRLYSFDRSCSDSLSPLSLWLSLSLSLSRQDPTCSKLDKYFDRFIQRVKHQLVLL